MTITKVPVKVGCSNLSAYVIAGVTNALATIPDGIGSAILAGVNHLTALYALLTGMPVAALLDPFGSLYFAGAGLLSGGRDPQVRSVIGLGTAQRNLSAAILVSAQNFNGTMTLPFVLVASIMLLLILLPTARRMGAAHERSEEATVPATR